MKLVDVLGVGVEVSSGEPMVLLREEDAPHRVLPVVVGVPEAMAIAVAMSDARPPRPLTHDLMVDLVDSLDAHVDFVEVTEFRDDALCAELAVRGPGGSLRIDSRSSDAIAVAVRVDAPVFVSDEVLEAAGARLSIESEGDDIVVSWTADQAAIDAEVARFRDLLAEVDPSDFEDD